MCGRVACYLDSVTLAAIAKTHQLKNNHNYNRSYNIAPTSYLPAVYKRKSNDDKKSNERESELEAIKWGTHKKDGTAVINARVESLSYINQYKQSILKCQTCAIIIQGYYEWKEDKGIKQPYYITKNQSNYMIICGLYFNNENSEDSEKELVIITREAIKGLEFIHDRSPMFINENLMEEWINIKNLTHYEEVLNKIKAFNTNKDDLCLSYRIVGNLVNKLSNKGEDCIIHKEDLKYDKNKNYTLKGFYDKVKVLDKNETSKSPKKNNPDPLETKIEKLNKLNLISIKELDKIEKSERSSNLETTQSTIQKENKTAKKNKRSKVKHPNDNKQEIFLRDFLYKSNKKHEAK